MIWPLTRQPCANTATFYIGSGFHTVRCVRLKGHPRDHHDIYGGTWDKEDHDRH